MILGVIGLLSVGVIAACSSVLGSYYGWFSAGVAKVLGLFGIVALALGGLAAAALLILAVARLLAKLCDRYPEAVPKGKEHHVR